MNKKTYQVKFTNYIGLWEYLRDEAEDMRKTCSSWSGKYGTVTIDCSKKKSNKMNAYFWGVVLPEFQKAINKALKDKGVKEQVTRDEAEQMIREKFFSYSKTFVKKKLFYLSLKNIDWENKEFSDKIEEISEYLLHTFGHQIPEPKEG